MDSTIGVGSTEKQTALLTMDDASEFRDNANVSTAPLLSASGSEAAGDSSTDQRVNNVARTFGAAQDMTTTSDVDVDRITERLDREVALTKMLRLQTQSHRQMVLIKEKIQELHNEIPRLVQIHNDNASRKKEVINALHQEIKAFQELYLLPCYNTYDDTVVKLACEFHDRVSILQMQYRKEFELIDLHYSKGKETIRHTIQTQTAKVNAQTSTLRRDHSRELDEIQRRNTDIINNMRSMMESKREDLEEQVEYSQTEFVTTTTGTRSTYNQLKSKDDIMRAEISAKMHHAN